jgi:FkbM family methyltransferase
MFFLRLKKLGQIILDPVLTGALLKGAAAGMEHAALLANLPCECVIDVGANRGQFALVARKVFPKAAIYSFEPLEEPARIYKKIFDQDPQVKLYHCAIGKEKISSTIYITRDDDSSSLLHPTKTQIDTFPGAAEKEIRQVSVYPLSQLIDPDSIPPASLLKIDVQGYELEVLQGCEDLLPKFSHLYIECSFIELYEGQALAHQIVAWLRNRNLVLSSIHNLYYGKNGMAIQGDFLFSKI